MPDISFSAQETLQRIPWVVWRAVPADPDRAIGELFRTLDDWAQSHSEMIYVGASGTRLEHAESIQRCSALFYLELSGRTAEMVHQEAADKIVLIPEPRCHYIVGRKEEPCIFYAACTNHNCGRGERPPSSAYASELHRFDSRAGLGRSEKKYRCIGDERDIRSKITSSKIAAEPGPFMLVDGVTADIARTSAAAYLDQS